MNVDEQAAKELFAAAGIRVPRGRAASTPAEAEAVARELGTAVVVKPLLLSGGRGKEGLVRFAQSAEQARIEAEELLTHADRLRVEERVSIHRELYVAVVTDRSARCPRVLYASEGGVDVESARTVQSRVVDIRKGLAAEVLRDFPADVRPVLEILYERYRALDAELVEVNPFGVTETGELVALDAKLSLDESALARHPELALPPPRGTELERRAREAGLYYVELSGNVGVLANGAGLTMATLDAVRFYGGEPANFMEIGGDAYRKAREALELVLANPRVESLLVNLCGAYARTDVMVEGFLAGWAALRPSVPLAMSVHGTGQERAVRLAREALGIEPFDAMDDAVREAVSHV